MLIKMVHIVWILILLAAIFFFFLVWFLGVQALEIDCLSSHPGSAANWKNLCKLDSVCLFPQLENRDDDDNNNAYNAVCVWEFSDLVHTQTLAQGLVYNC